MANNSHNDGSIAAKIAALAAAAAVGAGALFLSKDKNRKELMKKAVEVKEGAAENLEKLQEKGNEIKENLTETFQGLLGKAEGAKDMLHEKGKAAMGAVKSFGNDAKDSVEHVKEEVAKEEEHLADSAKQKKDDSAD